MAGNLNSGLSYLINTVLNVFLVGFFQENNMISVLHLIASTPNICNQLHLPAQCGSSKILEAMRRGYTRESYLELVDHVRSIIPEVRFSGDMIAGFCGETDEDFEETLSLIEKVRFGTLFVFPYSLREVIMLDLRRFLFFISDEIRNVPN